MEIGVKGKRLSNRGNRKRPISCGLIALAFIACACTTTAGKRLNETDVGTSFYGMVYDYDNLPVSNCLVIINESTRTYTDANGRFFFDYLDYGLYTIIFRKSGYEDATTSILFSLKTQMLYQKLVSQENLLSAAEKKIRERSWADARALLSRAQPLGTKEPLTSFLWATIFYREKDFVQAAQILENLIANDFRDPIIYVFLADIYQYHSTNKAQALLPLESALASKEDAELRERLTNLRKELGIAK